MQVKAVLVIGDKVTKTNTQDWYVTVGNNPDPLQNPTIFPLSTEWAKDINVSASG